jgi:hypothetical protein
MDLQILELILNSSGFFPRFTKPEYQLGIPPSMQTLSIFHISIELISLLYQPPSRFL